jgi:hypothetical protein
MRALRAAGFALLVASSILSHGAVPPAAGQEGQCDLDPVTLQCRVVAPVPIPGGPSQGGEASGGSSRGGGSGQAIPMTRDALGGGTETDCTWQTVTGAAADRYRGQLVNAPTAGAVQICDSGVGAPEVRIVPQADDPNPPPTPEEVAATVLARVQAQMRRPEVVTSPPVGTPSIVTLPVFVRVTNWVDPIDESDCVRGVCARLTAEPTLIFDPGEPGSSPIVCDPPGTAFDPQGSDPEVQAAAPGACAYAYRYRTGADGRPDAWHAQVIVSWDISWRAGQASGEFPAQQLATDVPREVDEVQTVVRD